MSKNNLFSIISGQNGLAGIWAVLLLVVLAAGFVFWKFCPVEFLGNQEKSPVESESQINKLNIGSLAKVETLDVTLEPARELDFKSKTEILELRKDAINKYPPLISGNYQPSKAVFGQVEGNRPWWGTTGLCYFGPGEKSIEGPSWESRSILNPYLLVVPRFGWVWKSDTIPFSELGSAEFPEYFPARLLRWYPRESKAEVTFSAAGIRRLSGVPINLVAYNARDFGLNYIYVSFNDSSNVSKADASAKAFNNPQFLHKDDSCNYPGGCNNITPRTPQLDNVKIDALPAEIVVWLWRDDPKTLAKLPDVTFILRFE